ncbi:unnamed protein product [Paramecium sonneborni]|uniref:Transmembrane protein n=1 Tax=Paramecium sonneborni TaxID=65129 RepID=A0A8S1MFH7_9CILI|nr:unnamed protein product [Paramecium sonneborni]
MKNNLQAKKNKRNITGGEIHLNQIDEADKINEDASQDYESNLIKVLDLQPEITKIFIENLTNGSFIELNEQTLRRKIQMMEESRKQQIQTENVLLVLNKLIHEAVKLIDRFIFFFQGLLAGQSTDQEGLTTFFKLYAKYCLRVDQVFHIIILISAFGSLFVCVQLKDQQEKTKNNLDKKFYIQSIISALFYNIAYLLWVIGHKNIVELSSGINQDHTNTQVQAVIDGSALYNFWTYTQIAITILTVLGWFISVNTTESNLNYLASVEADQIFSDENKKEK